MMGSLPEFLKLAAIVVLLFVSLGPIPGFAQVKNSALVETGQVLWRDPGNISTLDLMFGPGSPERAPAPPFNFVKEDRDGESPKFTVRDAKNVKWSVKLGVESQAETVATRIVWAMGYFVEETYYRDRVEIQNLPKLSRGSQFVKRGNIVVGARFEPRRESVKRGDNWSWLDNPFAGTREFNGLKVLMVLLANYDARPENNRVLTEKDPATGQTETRYVVTDLGATLGHVGGLGGKRSKNNLADYRRQPMVRRVYNGMMEFNYRTRPSGLGYFTYVVSPGYWKGQANKEKAMRQIHVDDARWMGQMLSRLTDEQLHDAFRAANYHPATANGFVRAIRERIDQIMRPPIRNGRNQS